MLRVSTSNSTGCRCCDNHLDVHFILCMEIPRNGKYPESKLCFSIVAVELKRL